jgi:hypothetical protein
MKQLICSTAAAATLLCALLASVVSGQAQLPVKPGGAPWRPVPVGPGGPSGFLAESLGQYLTIEGALPDDVGVAAMALGGSNVLAIDTINGRRLEQPILIRVSNVTIPAKTRCVLKGYELGEMIGRPPAEYDAAKERGEDAAKLVERDQGVWRWSPYFVVLTAAKPEGLKVLSPAELGRAGPRAR